MYEFTNRSNGEKLRCSFHLVGADSPQLIKLFLGCLYEEYGDTYTNSHVYDENAFTEDIRQGTIICMLAVTGQGDAAASLALAPSEGIRDVMELGMHVVRRQYRGFGIGTVLTAELLKQPEVKAFSSVTVHSVTFHPKAQHQTINCGLVPTGFLLNIHRNEIIRHSFKTQGVVKQSFTVSVFPEGKRDAGRIYPPAEHREFISGLYSRLGVNCAFGEGEPLSGKTRLSRQQDEEHRTMFAQIYDCGEDIEEWAAEEMETLKAPEQTINLLIDLGCPRAPAAYERLRALGFVFSGMQPLCGDGEFMIMHQPMGLDIQFDKLCIDEGYREVFDYIKDRA